MDPELLATLERLAALGTQILPLPSLTSHFVFERDGCVVLVERKGESFGAVGSPGKLVDAGFAALIERDGRHLFVHKGQEWPAEPSEVSAARRLFTDLKTTLRQL